MVVALAAVNLAVTRAALGVDIYPQVLVVLLGSVDFLIIWKLILNRPLRAFHYTFPIVFVIAFFVLAHFGNEVGARVQLPWQLLGGTVVVTMAMALVSGLAALRSLRD